MSYSALVTKLMPINYIDHASIEETSAIEGYSEEFRLTKAWKEHALADAHFDNLYSELDDDGHYIVPSETEIAKWQNPIEAIEDAVNFDTLIHNPQPRALRWDRRGVVHVYHTVEWGNDA